MGMDASRIKRLFSVGVILGSFALAACGGYGQAPLASSASGMQHFNTASLQAFGSTLSQASSISRRVSAASRQRKDVCGNLAVVAEGDPHYKLQGTLSNGKSVNLDWEDTSSGYANWLTSPIDGGYNVALTQTEEGNKDATFITSFDVTTHGNTIVHVTNAPLDAKFPLVSIIDTGSRRVLPQLSSDFQLTLNSGEQIAWHVGANPNDPTSSGKVSGSLTETVSGGNTGGITMVADYIPISPSSFKGNNAIGANNITVNASNVDLGGYVITTAMGDGTVPCSNSTPASTPTSTPASTPASTPTPVPSPTSSPCMPTASSPDPHPTQNPTVGGACSTS